MVIIKMIVRDLFHSDVNLIIKTWILKSKFVNLDQHLELEEDYNNFFIP